MQTYRLSAQLTLLSRESRLLAVLLVVAGQIKCCSPDTSKLRQCRPAASKPCCFPYRPALSSTNVAPASLVCSHVAFIWTHYVTLFVRADRISCWTCWLCATFEQSGDGLRQHSGGDNVTDLPCKYEAGQMKLDIRCNLNCCKAVWKHSDIAVCLCSQNLAQSPAKNVQT